MAKKTRLTKDSPERKKRDLEVARLRLEGKPVREIANQVGLGPSQVSNILSDKEIKDILEREMRVYAAPAKGIGKQFLKLRHDPDKHVKLKAIEGYHKVMGMGRRHTQNLFIQNLMVQQNNFLQGDAFRKVAMEIIDPTSKDEAEEEKSSETSS